MTDLAALAALTEEIVACRRCPRLVAWRERVAREKVARFRDETYWGRPLPGFGDPEAHILLVGLAPAAHGGNRTGRVFTGDASGDFLWAALHAQGLADRPASRRAGDGLTLRDAYVAAAVRCAPPLNKPTVEERDNCAPFLARELALLSRIRIRSPSGSSAGTRRCCHVCGGPRCAPEASVRAPRRGESWPVRPARRVSPEPAEHVHLAADAFDVRRGASTGEGHRGRLSGRGALRSKIGSWTSG